MKPIDARFCPPALKACHILFLAVLLILFHIPGYGQLEVGLNVDSLKRSLESTSNDTLKVETCIRLGQQYESNQPDSAIYYYQMAGSLSERLNYPEGIVQYINNYTAVLNVQGKFNESLALNLRAVRICKEHHLAALLPKALINTGVVYQYMNRYPLAVNYYLEALPEMEAGGNPQALSFIYGNLCGIYRDLKQPSRALDYARKALRLADQNHDRYAAASAYNNLGNALNDLNKAPQAIGYFQKARQIGQSINDIDIQETALINLGNAYMKEMSPEQYIASFKAALPLADSLEDVYGKASALQGIALGLYYQRDYKKAAALLDSSIAFAKKYHQEKVLSDMLLLMSDIQIASGNIDLAGEYRSSYDSLTNQFMNVSLQKNIQELEVKYDVEKKQRMLLENRLLIEKRNSENLRQRRWLAIAATGILMLLLSLFLGYRVYRQKQQLNAKTIQALKNQEEAAKLKARLEGEQQERRRISQEMHDDMGSDLTRILFLSRTLPEQESAATKIRQTIEVLIKKMNEIIWVMNAQQDTLENLVIRIHSTISEMLDDVKIPYHITVPECIPEANLSQEFRRNVYLSAKEAVHNAIRHSGATEINVDISIDHHLIIVVRDNGKGLDDMKRPATGNGLKNMQERLSTVRGRFDISSSGGTRITLDVPLGL